MARTRINLNVVEVNTYITGYHIYKNEWEPTLGEELLVKMEPKNRHDRYAVSVQKDRQIVGHIERGEGFAQTIFFFLRADETARCVATINGKPTNLGDSLGQKIPCSLRLTGKKQFVKVLKDNLP